MVKNESGFDRVARVILGAIALWAGLLPLGGSAGATLGLVVAVVGLVLLVTGLVGFCLIYRILGFSTKP